MPRTQKTQEATSQGRGGAAERRNLLLEELILSVLGGTLLGLPFVFPALFFVHYLALVPWVVLFVHPRYRANALMVLPGTYIYSLLDLRPFQGFNRFLPLVLGLFYFLPCLLFPVLLKWLRGRRAWPLSVLLPLVWIPTEWFRVQLSAMRAEFYFLGSSQFPWTRLIQVADLAGIYGVSFLVAAMSGLICDWTLPLAHASERERSARGRWVSTAIVAAEFVAALCYGTYRLGQTTQRTGPRIAIIQPNKLHYFDRAKREAILPQEIQFTRAEIFPGSADLIVWPENAVDDLLNNRPDYQAQLAQLAREERSYLLVGAYTRLSEGFLASSYLFSPEGSLLSRYDKMNLLPWSEKMPFDGFLNRVWPWLARAQVRLVRYFLGYAGNGTPGKILQIFRVLSPEGQAAFASPICFEASHAGFARTAAQNGANFLVNITSEGPLGPTFYTHMVGLAEFRAVENRMGVVRAANTGVSLFIDPNGRTQSVLRGKQTGALYFEEGALTDRVTLDARCGATFYSRYGNVFVLLCAIGVIACGVFPRNQRAWLSSTLMLTASVQGAAGRSRGPVREASSR